MSLISVLTSGFQRVGAEFKSIRTALASKASLNGSTVQPFSSLWFVANGESSIGGVYNAESLRVLQIASAVNRVAIAGAAANGEVTVGADGATATVPINFTSKGAALVNFRTNGTVRQAAVGHVASAINYLLLKGGSSASIVPTLTVDGTDTNIDVALKPKGAGLVVADGTFVSTGLERNTNIAVVTTTNVAAITITARTTVINSSGSATIALTFPAAAAAINGQLHTITCTTGRNVSAVLNGATAINGMPTAINAATPFTMMFETSTNQWHRV